jgi:hypothetical protein
MASAEYYCAEAKRCRELAARAVAGSIMAQQWLKIAAEYDTLAEALEAPGFMAGSRMTSQPMQQQQAKKTDPEDEK